MIKIMITKKTMTINLIKLYYIILKYKKQGGNFMSNSKLVNYTKLSPNHSGARTHSIDRITPHCVVGQCSVETLTQTVMRISQS